MFDVDDSPAQTLASACTARLEAHGVYHARNDFWVDIDFKSVRPMASHAINLPSSPGVLEAVASRTTALRHVSAPRGVFIVNTTPCRWMLALLKMKYAQTPSLRVMFSRSLSDVVDAVRREPSASLLWTVRRPGPFRLKGSPNGGEVHSEAIAMREMLSFLIDERIPTFFIPAGKSPIDVELGRAVDVGHGDHGRQTPIRWRALSIGIAVALAAALY